ELFGFEFSSRRHPRKFGVKRFLVVREVAGAEVGWPVLGYLLGKNYRRRDRNHLVPPRRMDAAVCRAEVCYAFGRKHGRHRAVKRREFITLLGSGVAGWPLAARAQQPAMPVIGFLNPTAPEVYADELRAFHRGLKEAGFVEGDNVATVYRWAEGEVDRLPALAADLVSRKVSVLASTGTAVAAFAAKTATATIPIVFIVNEDPVRLGLVASLASPGGNLTGTNILTGEIVAKRLELLRELAPGMARVAVLVDPANALTTEATLRQLEPAARATGLQVQSLNART